MNAHCRGVSCHQGRRGCETSQVCGLLNQKEQSAEAADIPPWTPTDIGAWIPNWALVLLIVALLAALLFWPGLYEHWPRMVTWVSM